MSVQGVTTLVFPTAWQNVPPHLTAIGFHSGYHIALFMRNFYELIMFICLGLAREAQLNYLAANRHYPPKQQGGSGVYSSSGVVAASSSSSSVVGSSMVMAELPVTPLRCGEEVNQAI